MSAEKNATNTVTRPSVTTPLHFINNEFVPARSGGTFEVVDPATEQLTTMAARGDAQDIEAAVKAAKERVRRRRLVAREAVIPPQGAVQSSRPDRGTL